MVNANNLATAPVLSSTRRGNGRKVGVATVVVLLLLFALCAVFYEAAQHSRFWVVGKIDPASGYRIQYSVSSHYHKSETSARLEQAVFQESFIFGPEPSPRPLNWIHSHLPHAPSDKRNGSSMMQYTLTSIPKTYQIDSHGYPEVIAPTTRTSKATGHQHTLVCGFPSTYTVFEVQGQDALVRVDGLFIHPTDSSIIYAFYGDSSGDNENAEMKREMAAIRDSIRIVKAR